MKKSTLLTYIVSLVLLTSNAWADAYYTQYKWGVPPTQVLIDWFAKPYTFGNKSDFNYPVTGYTVSVASWEEAHFTRICDSTSPQNGTYQGSNYTVTPLAGGFLFYWDQTGGPYFWGGSWYSTV